MSVPAGQGLMAPSDIADLVGVSRAAVSNWRRRHDDFPPAIAGSDSRPLYSRAAVVRWLESHGHQVREASHEERVWSAINSLRGSSAEEQVVPLLLLLASIKKASDSGAIDFDFEAFAQSPVGAQEADLPGAVAQLSTLANFEVLERELPARGGPALQVMAHAVSATPTPELAAAADFVLERMARGQIKMGGEYGFVGSRTSALMESLVKGENATVYDPACGIAVVLVRAADQDPGRRLVGRDVDGAAVLTAAERALLHDAEIDLAVADVFEQDPDPALLADIVTVEPPLGTRMRPPRATLAARYPFGLPPAKSADMAWIQHAIAHLAPSGTAYVITTSAPLNSSGAEGRIRKSLVNSGCVEAVVGLPAKMLPQTASPLALWVLTRPSDRADVLLIDASDVADVEHHVASWLTDPSAMETGSPAPHTRVAVNDLLASEANLSPRRWVAEATPDSAAIIETFSAASADVSRLARQISETATLPAAGVAMEMGMWMADDTAVFDYPPGAAPESSVVVTPPRMETIDQLSAARVLKHWLGSSEARSEESNEAQPTRVTPHDLQAGHLPPVKKAAATGRAPITQPGDVLVSTVNQVCALVDDEGGRAAGSGVSLLRIVQPETLLPEYLAAMICGSWNARHQHAGSSRVRLRDLEIPLAPLEEQHRIAEAHKATMRMRKLAGQLADSASQAFDAMIDATRYDIDLTGVNWPEG